PERRASSLTPIGGVTPRNAARRRSALPTDVSRGLSAASVAASALSSAPEVSGVDMVVLPLPGGARAARGSRLDETGFTDRGGTRREPIAVLPTTVAWWRKWRST